LAIEQHLHWNTCSGAVIANLDGARYSQWVPYCPVRLLFDTVIVVFVWSVICAVVVVFAARYRLVSSGMNCTGTVVVLTGRNTGRYVSENSPSLAV